MSAGKKEPKAFTLSQVSEQAYEAYWEGMADCHEITMSTMEQLRNSLEDVHSIYYMGVIIGDRKQKAEELVVAMDTLTHLMDAFQGNYDLAMDKSKALRNREEAIANSVEFNNYK